MSGTSKDEAAARAAARELLDEAAARELRAERHAEMGRLNAILAGWVARITSDILVGFEGDRDIVARISCDDVGTIYGLICDHLFVYAACVDTDGKLEEITITPVMMPVFKDMFMRCDA